jgi:hypothetical protein
MADLLWREVKDVTDHKIAALIADVNVLKLEKFHFSELSG